MITINLPNAWNWKNLFREEFLSSHKKETIKKLRFLLQIRNYYPISDMMAFSSKSHLLLSYLADRYIRELQIIHDQHMCCWFIEYLFFFSYFFFFILCFRTRFLQSLNPRNKAVCNLFARNIWCQVINAGWICSLYRVTHKWNYYYY